MIKKQIALIVLDGWGYREETKDNAIAEAKKPNFDNMWNKYPHTTLEASGLAVGLPAGQMGNSEVGHMTIGAGRPLDQDLVRIDKSISSGEFAKNPAFLELLDYVKKNNSILHTMGLLSPGGVHSHMNHLFAFLKIAKWLDKVAWLISKSFSNSLTDDSLFLSRVIIFLRFLSAIALNILSIT